MLNHTLLLIFILIPFSLPGQVTSPNSCNFNFRTRIDKNKSIPLFAENGDIVMQWTQSTFDYIEPYLVVDKSLSGKMRLKSINLIVEYLNNSMDTSPDSKVDSLNQLFSNLWIQNKHLQSRFGEWVYMDDLDDNDTINKPYIYKRPTTQSSKQLVNPRDWHKTDSNGNKPFLEMNFLDCKGRWVEIEIKLVGVIITGWMPWYNFCHHTLTLCHYLPEDGVENAE